MTQSKFKITLFLVLLVVSIGGPVLILYWNQLRLNVMMMVIKSSQMSSLSAKFPQVVVRSEQLDANPERIRVILFWVPFFSQLDYGFGMGREPFADCEVSACETTSARSRLSTSDAVILHLSNLDVDDMPPVRYDDQRWIFFTLESPTNTVSSRSGRVIDDLRLFNGHFNWTMTYRRDSDIRMPYFDVVNGSSGGGGGGDADALKKSNNSTKKRLVGWLVSNCETKSRREAYANALRRQVLVDVYGECGRPCDQPRRRPWMTTACDRSAFDEHKFYLSFENSVCRDYVTEKLSNALRSDAVPIVYGGAHYAEIAPPHSYLDVRDFESPEHLARHLLQLDANETAYREFSRWKAKYSLRTDEALVRRAFCDLCAALHDDQGRRPRKAYEDLHRWWIVDAKCAAPSQVPIGYPKYAEWKRLATLELAHGFPRET